MASDQHQPRAQSPFQTQAQKHHHPPALVPLRGAGLRVLAAGLLLASQAPALAGSVTAESIWDSTNAIQRATSQIPSGATVTGNSCQEVDMRGGDTRYICTVTYSSPPPAPAPTPAAAPGASPIGPGSIGPNPNAPSAPAP